METPEYKVLQDSFMEPNHVKAGSIVRTWGPPGPHLQPLNESARQKMEEWFTEEFDEIDPKTGKTTGQKVRPHEKFRIRTNYATPSDRHHIEVVSGPPRDQPGSLSLAETLSNPRASTDQRPAPSAVHMPPPEAIPAATAPIPSPPQPPPPLMHDEKGRNAAIPEPPTTKPEELPPVPSTPADGTANPPEPIPAPTFHDPIPSTAQEPEATEVVFSAPPPSARRNA